MRFWQKKDLERLESIRARYLEGDAGKEDYWTSEDDLRLYDRTFGERIGWKWDAVLAELEVRGWKPTGSVLFDWGCGTGVASRRMLAKWPGVFRRVVLFDRSVAAVRFATRQIREEFPTVEVTASPSGMGPDVTVVASHVLSELTPEQVSKVVAGWSTASEILWVEAGTHVESRRLIAEVREPLRQDWNAVAPCTHSDRCGMLADHAARHWCHSFARTPGWVAHDGSWSELSRALGIDLRSLPYCFLALTRKKVESVGEGMVRVIGRPRVYKGYQLVLRCDASGVADVRVQKRDAGDLWRWLDDLPVAPITRLETHRPK